MDTDPHPHLFSLLDPDPGGINLRKKLKKGHYILKNSCKFGPSHGFYFWAIFFVLFNSRKLWIGNRKIWMYEWGSTVLIPYLETPYHLVVHSRSHPPPHPLSLPSMKYELWIPRVWGQLTWAHAGEAEDVGVHVGVGGSCVQLLQVRGPSCRSWRDSLPAITGNHLF